MLILLVGLAFLILSFSSFTLSYQINGINRVVVSTPITIFESSIMHDLDDYDPVVLFTKSLVKEKLDRYYSIELSKFTDKFSYEMYFYNSWNESMCIYDECDAVEITFSATLLYNYQYHRVLNFEVYSSTYGS